MLLGLADLPCCALNIALPSTPHKALITPRPPGWAPIQLVKS